MQLTLRLMDLLVRLMFGRELVPNSLLQTRDNSRPASAGKADGKKGGFRKKKK